MTQAHFEVRKQRSDNGALIASRTEEGFRVYSLQNPSNVYLVKQEGEQRTCTCPDFEAHKTDNGKATEAIIPLETHGEPPNPKRRARKDSNGSAQMLIKRSVSPDGRIDSVSVEFSMPVSDISNGEIKEKALKILQLQKEIVGAFLKLNGEKASANAAPP